MNEMTRREALSWLAGSAVAVGGLELAPTPYTLDPTPIPGRHMLMSVYSPANKLFELSAEGRVVWEHTYPSLVVMFEPLPNGNIMYAYGGNPTGVQEIDRDHKVVW